MSAWHLLGRTDRPCPPWCSLPPGHHFDSLELPGEEPCASRYHELRVGRVESQAFVFISVREQAPRLRSAVVDENGCELLELVGSSTFEKPSIDTDVEDPLDAAAARALARLLVEAASALESLVLPVRA